jgi:hypothetical protein
LALREVFVTPKQREEIEKLAESHKNIWRSPIVEDDISEAFIAGAQAFADILKPTIFISRKAKLETREKMLGIAWRALQRVGGISEFRIGRNESDKDREIRSIVKEALAKLEEMK